MIRWLLPFCCCIGFLPACVSAETLLAATAIRAGSVLSATDLKLSEVQIAGALRAKEQAIGRQTSRNLFPGHAIFPEDLHEPHLVKRNQLVTITFHSRGLSISTEGRALDGGALGDRIRVLNASSRATVIGKVLADGSISVSGALQ